MIKRRHPVNVEVSDFARSIAAFAPKQVCVEVLPKHQAETDSPYTLYMQNKLDLNTLENGRREVYQIAFRVNKVRRLFELSPCLSYGPFKGKSSKDNIEFPVINQQAAQHDGIGQLILKN